MAQNQTYKALLKNNRCNLFPHSDIRAFTITELIITVGIISMMMTYAWQIYFSGAETMRHGVSQSQMQSETRIFFDHLGREISQAYRFIDIDLTLPNARKFSFYSFQFTRTTLERVLYDEGDSVLPQNQNFLVLKIAYTWSSDDNKVTRTQTPGNLYFLRKPMVFEPAPPNSTQYSGTPEAPSTKAVLQNIQDFEIHGYEQNYKKNYSVNEDPFTIREITGIPPGNASLSTFLTLRLHNKVDEVGKRRDEELDLVAKFYSRVRLADAAYPGYFGTMDENQYY